MGWSRMVSLASKAAIGESPHESLRAELTSVSKASYIPGSDISMTLVEGWSAAIDQFLADSVISEEEETRLTKFAEEFSLGQDDLDFDGAYTRMVQGAALGEVLEGKIPSRINITGSVPFNLQKSESLVWLFQDVPYYEDVTRRERKGGYQGVSVRVMKGVYYNTGGFQSRSVERVSTELADEGLLGITTKHVYFAGPRKKFRVPYAKMVSIEPYADGIEIMRDAASAKPQKFITGDGWFIYNLVANLAQGTLSNSG